MISTLAGNLCAVESDLKVALKTVEQQGRFMADQSVRIDQLEQRLCFTPPDAATTAAVAEMADMMEQVKRDIDDKIANDLMPVSSDPR
jgi:hypothetical protein